MSTSLSGAQVSHTATGDSAPKFMKCPAAETGSHVDV